MKRTIKVVGEDRGRELTVTIEATINSRNGLTRGETKMQAQDLANMLADDLRALRYSDFGVHNTRVRV